MNVGIVGLGHVATHQIAAIDSLDGLELTAVCDVDPTKRSNVAPNLAFFADLRAFLASDLFEVALISVPTVFHYHVAISALEAGRHVVVEKPISSDLKSIDMLASYASSQQQLIYSALHASFGREVEWFHARWSQGNFDSLGPISGFSCRFYDPYLQQKKLVTGANSLEGSWFDSAINALSVIARFIPPSSLHLNHSTQTIVPGLAPREIQGAAELTFQHGGVFGRGTIDTNWTLGIDSKLTHLFFASGHEIVLQHSTESVQRISPTGESTTLVSLADDTPRLTAHYIGVYADLKRMVRLQKDNLVHSRALHAIVFAAYEALKSSQLAEGGAKL